MAFSEESILSILALVFSVVSILCTFYIEKRRQRERREDIGRGIEKDYEDIDGSGLLEKFNEFKSRKGAEYWEDYIREQPTELKEARWKLKKFWERTIKGYESGNVPDGFFLYNGNQWLQSGHNYRMVVEPIDIANYYHHRFWRDSGHYLEGNNRPLAYKFFEDKWNGVKGNNTSGDSVKLARDKQRQIERSISLPRAEAEGDSPGHAVAV